jgi:hypothetical protein
VTRCLAASAVLLALPTMAGAGSAVASFSVSADVPPRVILETVSAPESLAVSADDLSRGYVDVAALYRVRSNDPAGYLVRLAPRTGLATEVQVGGLATPVVVREATVAVVEAWTPVARELHITFRVLLQESVPEGVYPLPVLLYVSPL